MKYAFNGGSGWSIETVDSTGKAESCCSIVIDSSNLPHISYYYGFPDYDLIYAHNTGSGWSIETVESAGSVGTRSSIAVDSSDRPHIGYLGNTDLKYAYKAGSSWNIETVDSTDVDISVSMALDSSDLPHISYEDFTNTDLKYAHYTGSTWSIELVDSEDAGPQSSIAVDSSDGPHISYVAEYSALKLLRYSYMLQPTIKASPPFGPQGSTISVQGAGFEASEQVDLYLDTTFVKSITATTSGEFSGTFRVPAVVDGDYALIARGVSSGIEASTPFSVRLFLVILSPDHGQVGDTIIITGNGFTAEEAWSAYLSTSLVDSGTVASGGTVTGSFTVPSYSAGEYPLVVYDEATGIGVPVTFTIDASATLEVTPQYQVQAGMAYAQGTGFEASEQVDLYLDTTFVKSITATTSGEFSGTFRVPAVVDGDYTLRAIGQSSGIEASTPFRVGIMLVIVNPDHGQLGDTISFTGVGFTEGRTWSAYLSTSLVDSGMVASGGTVTGSFTVPLMDEPGDYTFTVVDEETGIEVTTTFTVEPPTFGVSPSSGPPGSTVDVQGTGFTPDEQVDLYLGGIFLKSITADYTGEFSGSFVVPATWEGMYQLYARGLTSGLELETPFWVEEGAMTFDILPDHGPVGAMIYFAGTGFTVGGTWSAYLGPVLVNEGAVAFDGTLASSFTVPIMGTGTYTFKLVDDERGYKVQTTFTVDFNNIVYIGVTAASTDGLADTQTLLDIAEDDVNSYLSGTPAGFTIQYLLMDNEANEDTALQNTVEFHERGIDIIAGHGWSTQCAATIGYVDANDMFMFSSSSTAVSLALPDNLFRLTTNEAVQGGIIAQLYSKLGVDAVIIYYSDWWYGQEVCQYIEDACDDLGIEVIESIPYNPGSWDSYGDFEYISSLIESNSLSYAKIGFQVCAPNAAELGVILEEAYWHDNVQDVTWFGDTLTTSYAQQYVSQHPFLLTRVKLYGPQRAPDYDSLGYIDVSSRFYAATSHDIGYYMTDKYDILMILAESMVNVGWDSATAVRDEAWDLTQGYVGISGTSTLDINGDRISEDHDIMGFHWVGGEASYVRSGYYDQDTGMITMLPLEEEPSETTWSVFPLSGPTGTEAAISGYGFTPEGEWDATFETVDLFPDPMYADIEGSILGLFRVPLLSPGVYPLNVVDISTGVMSTLYFTVTGIGVPDGVVCWWPGDGNAYDIIGGNHGEPRNGVTYALGMVDEAFSFDGLDDVVDMHGDVTDDLQELSIELWVKLNSVPGNVGRFVTLNGEKAVLRHDGENDPGQLHFYMTFEDPVGMQHIRVDDALQAGTFYHVAGTYDGSYMRLYLDGLEVGSLMVDGTPVTGDGVMFSAETETLDGLLDEVCVYNRALTPEEVRLIYDAGPEGKCGPVNAFVTVASFTDPACPYMIPEGEIIPIQSAMKPDVEGDGILDLVIGKPTAILVNVGEELDPSTPFALLFTTASATILLQAQDAGNNLYVLENFPTDNLQPGSTGWFECHYVTVSNVPHDLAQQVKFISTIEVPLTITSVARFKKTGDAVDYGYVEDDDYGSMTANTQATMEGTYPANLLTYIDNTPIAGASSGRNYKGILADIAAALQKAQLNANPPGSALAIVVAPNMVERSAQTSIIMDYFEYHGLPGVAGISFGPGYRGVVSLDGYYWSPAHEIGHVYDLYWGEPEQYMLVQNAPGFQASGAWVSAASVIDAYDFMGIGDFENPYSNWVCPSTYVELLQKVRTGPTDPEIILVNGLIYEDGTVEQLLPWYSISEGVPDVIPSGDYTLRFLDQNDAVLLDVSFDADFFMHIDPGRNVPSGTECFGMTPIGAAPFAFVAEYKTATETIQIIDNTDPENPEVLYEVPASEVQEHPVANAGGPYTAAEGETVTFDASSSLGDDLQYRWDFDADGIWDTDWSTCPTASCTWDDSWDGTVLLEVTDGTLSQVETIKVTIMNAPPVINPIDISLDPFPVNTEVHASATFSDVAHDSHTAEWDWGDGTDPIHMYLGAGECFTECTHTYVDPGVYTLTLTVTDDQNEASTMEHKYVVVYDPSGGFVTGGGWIMSPAGAYTPDPTLSGKATFGFVSKYVKSSNVPVGKTEFVFHVAGFKFLSTSYDWLVVAGSNAKYKGTGTVNGEGVYGFMLTAYDGDLKDDVDTFRIKIWDKTTDAVIYDNKMGEPDDSYEGAVLGGGNIVVHKAK